MDYSPWSEREIWPILKANEKEHNLLYRRGYGFGQIKIVYEASCGGLCLLVTVLLRLVNGVTH